MRINFSFLSNRCVFDSFFYWFSIEFLKLYLLSVFFFFFFASVN